MLENSVCAYFADDYSLAQDILQGAWQTRVVAVNAGLYNLLVP